MAVENIRKSGDFQAEYEGSIPSTRSRQSFVPVPQQTLIDGLVLLAPRCEKGAMQCYPGVQGATAGLR